jgi:hypothetical protein
MPWMSRRARTALVAAALGLTAVPASAAGPFDPPPVSEVCARTPDGDAPVDVRRLFLISDTGLWDLDAALGTPAMVDDEPTFPGTVPRDATARAYGRWDATVTEPQRIRCATAEIQVDGPTTSADALLRPVHAVLTVDGRDVATDLVDGRGGIIVGSPSRVFAFDFGPLDVTATRDVRLTIIADDTATTLRYDGFGGYGLSYAWQPPESP